ncbi:MAG: AAA family ATPase, partial [Proteobacteria bacterium]
VTALKNAGTSNPVIMLDEIDKMASDHRGDPSSALLEVLDPSQNHAFVDHYLGVPFDLSDIMFVANANTLDTIPAPLRDRLEIIDVSGYSEEEKLAIANQYLIPKQLKESGLDKANVVFTKNSVATIINGYTRESGLRGLDKRIGAVCRKLARIYAEQTDMWDTGEGLKLTPQMIQKHLGAQRYDDNFFHKEDRAGVSLGLAYTQYGGEVMAIECSLVPTGKHGMVLTGKLGEVMKESAQAALSYVRSHIHEFGLSAERLDKNELHIHVPAGAVPKDGPSAGIAMATAIISALSNKAPKRFAMTGEITIHGKVLPIGGLKEKLLAAIREGVKEVVLPEKNKSVFMELPIQVRKNLKAHFVKDYNEAFELLFDFGQMHTGKVESIEKATGPRGLAS